MIIDNWICNAYTDINKTHAHPHIILIDLIWFWAHKTQNEVKLFPLSKYVSKTLIPNDNQSWYTGENVQANSHY